MLESRVIKRCYPRLSVPSHLYPRNAYVERRPSVSPAVCLSSSLKIDDCRSRWKDGEHLADREI